MANKNNCCNPGSSLSLQMHHHRLILGLLATANIEIDNKQTLLTENQSTYIPLGSKHRLSNPGKVLNFKQAQSGEYLSEDDI